MVYIPTMLSGAGLMLLPSFEAVVEEHEPALEMMPLNESSVKI